MARILYGSWNGSIIDNRGRSLFEIEEDQQFKDFDELHPGNQIKAFFSGKGFFVFERGVNLLDALLQYVEVAANESCGKCTPCRVGTRIISSLLHDLVKGLGDARTLDELQEQAEHMQSTSMCGLGQTAMWPLLEVLKHFRDELAANIASTKATGPAPRQPGHTYVTAPCIEACPIKLDIPRYIDYIKDGRFTSSLGVILQKYPLVGTCGRVCVSFCEMACRRRQVDAPVGIRVLKRFVSEYRDVVAEKWFSPEMVNDPKPAELKVAVIGAGPAGLTAAYNLLLEGFPVDVFETRDRPGGMADQGIPEYRLPKEILHKEAGIVESLGGHIFYNQRLGRDFTIQELFSRGYKAVFLAIGTHTGKLIGIPGENEELAGYETGVKFLLDASRLCQQQSAPTLSGKIVAVVGGGNTAMDCARTALRLGATEVHIIYRRELDDMPADRKEVEDAMHEGVVFHFLTHPKRIISENGMVRGMELIRMKKGEPDERGNPSIYPLEGSEKMQPFDVVISAIGQQVDARSISAGDALKLGRWGEIDVDPLTLKTSSKGVFAGGDCATGPATLIQAMAHGLKASRNISDYLTYGRTRFYPLKRMRDLVNTFEKMNSDWVEIPVLNSYRVEVEELDPQQRRAIFDEVEKPISLEDAYHEAERCMRCYRIYSIITER